MDNVYASPLLRYLDEISGFAQNGSSMATLSSLDMALVQCQPSMQLI